MLAISNTQFNNAAHTHRRRILKERLIRHIGANQPLIPVNPRLLAKEVLELPILGPEPLRPLARAMEVGLTVTLLLVQLGREPVQMRLGVGLEEVQDIALSFAAVLGVLAGDGDFVLEVG